MSEPTSFRSIIELWSSREAMASEIGAGASAVSKWWQRDSIPSEWWAPIVASPTGSNAGLTAEALMMLAARDMAPAMSAEARA